MYMNILILNLISLIAIISLFYISNAHVGWDIIMR